MPDIKHHPKATKPFLRYQIGETRIRPEREPIYRGRTITGHKTNANRVFVWHLLGCGSTREKTMEMAGVKENEL